MEEFSGSLFEVGCDFRMRPFWTLWLNPLPLLLAPGILSHLKTGSKSEQWLSEAILRCKQSISSMKRARPGHQTQLHWCKWSLFRHTAVNLVGPADTSPRLPKWGRGTHHSADADAAAGCHQLTAAPWPKNCLKPRRMTLGMDVLSSSFKAVSSAALESRIPTESPASLTSSGSHLPKKSDMMFCLEGIYDPWSYL